MRLSRYGILPDSGGVGEWRGGNGTYREYIVETDSDLWLWFERSETTAWGLFGGGNGAAPCVTVDAPGQASVDFLKINGHNLPQGTVIRSRTGGGGGYGQALDRDPETVLSDVIDGYVTPAFAKSAYGVIVDDQMTLDHAATLAARRR